MNPNAMRGLADAKPEKPAYKRAVWRVVLRQSNGYFVTTVAGTLRDVIKARKHSSLVNGYDVQIESIVRVGDAA